MNIADIFKDIHGALNKSSLIPFSKMIGKKKGFPNKKQFKELVTYLGVKQDEVYYDPNSILNSLIYLSGYIYMPLHHYKVEVLQEFQTRERLDQIRKNFEQLELANDYEAIFAFMDKKILIPTYIEIFNRIPNDQRYEIFVDLHIRSEYGFEMFDEVFLKKVFEFRKYSKEYKKRMKNLKKRIGDKSSFTVYHGHNRNHDPKDEYSWTLNLNTAKFFANRFNNKDAVISEKQIALNDVIDFYDHRGEAEIILLGT